MAVATNQGLEDAAEAERMVISKLPLRRLRLTN